MTITWRRGPEKFNDEPKVIEPLLMFELRDTWRVSGLCGSLPLLPGQTDTPQKRKGSLRPPGKSLGFPTPPSGRGWVSQVRRPEEG